MAASLGKHLFSTAISVLPILGLLATAWFFPYIGILLGMIFLLFGLVTSIYIAVKKYRGAYLQGKISLARALRNVCFETGGLMLAMTLAGELGRSAAAFATGQIGHELTRLISGVLVGLLVGTVVGLFVKQLSSHLVKT
jgi:hypothetical protein